MDRRQFLKTAGVTATSAIGTNILGCTAAKKRGSNLSARDNKKIKNILFLLVDQQRADCLGCYGNSIVQTPNIDYLAKNGVRFDNAFTPAAVCSPARTCIQTGVLAHRHGLIYNSAMWECLYRGGLQDLGDEWPVFSKSLKKKGYNLAHIGKWHIGTDNRPIHFGYEGVFYPKYGYPAEHPHYLDYLKKIGVERKITERKLPRRQQHEWWTYSGLQNGPQEASVPGYLANQTIDKINKYTKSSKPFFICTSFWGPHSPYLLTEKHFRMYDKMKIPVWENFRYDMSKKPRIIERYSKYWCINNLSAEELSVLIGKYYGFISLIDEEIGRILKCLKDNGLLDNTLIVYSADHGATVGSHSMWDKGFGMYDCTQRIPFIMSHPSLKGKGYVSDEYVSLLDLAPTFLDIANCSIPSETDGVSLARFLEGPGVKRQRDHIICEHFGHQMPFWQRMVRTDSEKYVYNPTSIDEFYDLENDPYEMNNIIDRIPKEKLEQYRNRLDEWIKKTKDPLATAWAQTALHI